MVVTLTLTLTLTSVRVGFLLFLTSVTLTLPRGEGAFRYQSRDRRAEGDDRDVGTVTTPWDLDTVPVDTFHVDVDEVVLSAGHFHTCALEFRHGRDVGGPVKCWGTHSRGRASPPPGRPFVQLSCGHLHCCAVAPPPDRTVTCWGGDMATDPFPSPTTAQPQPQPHPSTLGPFLQVSSGESHACAVRTNGALSCWGRNDYGERKPLPRGTFVQVSCGNGSSCAIRTNGTVACWGKNNEGQSNPPPEVRFKQISVSTFHHACGITFQDDISCWGTNHHGQSEFQQGPFLQVSTGPRSTCGIRGDLSLVCWGRFSTLPLFTEPRRDYDQITMGRDHLCAVDIDSRVHCWNKGPDMGAHDVPFGLVIA